MVGPFADRQNRARPTRTQRRENPPLPPVSPGLLSRRISVTVPVTVPVAVRVRKGSRSGQTLPEHGGPREATNPLLGLGFPWYGVSRYGSAFLRISCS